MMKSPANKSAPKARVMWMLMDRKIEGISFYTSATKEYADQVRVLVRPSTTQLARFANLTWEEKVEQVAAHITIIDTPQEIARRILESLGEQPGKGDGEK